MRLVALCLVPHRLGLPLPAEALCRWIRLWEQKGPDPQRLEKIARGRTVLPALAAPWWLDEQLRDGRTQGSAPGGEGAAACLPEPAQCEGLRWRLAPLRLGGRRARLLRCRWQRALLLYETACRLAQQAGVPRPWLAGQLAALAPMLRTLCYRPRQRGASRCGWLPAPAERLQECFSWLEPMQRQLRSARERWLKAAAAPDAGRAGECDPLVLVPPAAGEPSGTNPQTAPAAGEPWQGPLQDHLAWAALAQLALQQAVVLPRQLHCLVQHARASAVARAARLCLPGKFLRQLALRWDRKRRSLLQSENDFQRRLFLAKQQALAHWAAGAGHMINNPLAVIAGRAQMALRSVRDPAAEKHLRIIQAQARRAHRMIAGLALYAQPPRLRREWMPLGQLLEELKRQFHPLARARNVRLDWDFAGELAVRADRYQLGVAVQALVENALAAVEDGGEVRVQARLVSDPGPRGVRPGQVIYGCGFGEPVDPPPEVEPTTAASRPPWAAAAAAPRMEAPGRPAAASRHRPPRETDGWLELSVADSGPGVSPQAAPWIFDPFYSGLEAGRGMGLGLCFVWRIVQQHGGAIRVDRTPSRFTLWMPQARVAADSPEPRQHGSHGWPPPPHVEGSADCRTDTTAS